MRGWPRFSRAKPIRTQAAGSETQNYRHNPSNEAQQVSEDGENQSQPPVSLADKYGIKVLHDPPGGTAVVDIVFVHGLTGDREKTWTADTAHDPWVKSFLPTVILTARILSFGYDADILHFLKPAGQNSIGMHAADLVAHLAYQRDTTDSSNRPIIFVAHSLGGLVCEDALLSSKNSVEPHLQRILECARAIAFFGTPHAGSDLTRFALTLTNLAKLFIKKPNNDLLGVLERKSEVLARIQGEFHKMIRARKDTGKPDIKIHCYIEQVPIEGLEKLVVPPESAVLSAYSHSTIHSNHMNMTKFGSQGDSGFILVSGDLLRWVNDLVTLNVITREEQDCLNSLSFPTMEFRWNDITPACKETCLWLFHKQEYRTWLNRKDPDDSKALLWIRGNPGAGKSTLMKHALKQAEERFQQDIVVWFFFNARGGDDLEKTPLGLFRSLLWQLFSKAPSLLREFLPSFRSKRLIQNQILKWHPQELQESLSSAIKNLRSRRILMFVDALDECEEQSARELVHYFEELVSIALAAGTHLNICVSSRHYPNISLGRFQELNVGHQNYPDILKYVQVKLQGNLSDEDISSLGNEVAERSSGVFLWVVLAIEMLNKAEEDGDTLTHKRTKLQKVPARLDEIFEQILKKIDSDNLPETLRMIQCVLFADGPLTAEELCYLVAFGAEQEDDQTSKLVTGHKQMEKFIRSRSGGLIEMRSHSYYSYTAQFIHESVRDFLVRQNGLQRCFEGFGEFNGTSPMGRGYDQLGRSCLNYIKTRAFHAQIVTDDTFDFRDPFLLCATKSVLKYAGKAEAEGISQWYLVDFFLWPTDHVFQFWRALYHSKKQHLFGMTRIESNIQGEGWTLLHFASQYNLCSWGVALLKPGTSGYVVGTDITEKDARGRTALHVAVQAGHKEMAQLLLSNGAEPDEKDDYGQTPLLLSAAHGHESLVLLLLNQEGVDPMSRNARGQTALICAASGKVQNGRDDWTQENSPNDEVVMLVLLRNGFDVNARDEDGSTALHWASRRARQALVRRLLDNGADISAKTVNGVIALHEAGTLCSEKLGSRKETIRLLLDGGADLESRDRNGMTLLLFAVCWGEEEIVEMLLEKGADATAKDDMGQTALLYAARRGKMKIVWLLLNKGADILARDRDGMTVLHHTAWDTGHLRLLINKGADVAAKDYSGRTVLHEAANYGHEETIRLLLDMGLDITTTDNDGRTVLHNAVIAHHIRPIFIPTPHVVARVVARVQLLIEKGADVAARDKNGQTVLHTAVKLGDEETIKLLLEMGSDITETDIDGQTVLHEAVQDQDLLPKWKDEEYEIMKLLLKKGANVAATDKRGQTVLHRAVERGRDEIVLLLLQNGANVAAKDHEGQTALHRAAEYGSKQTSLILLENGSDAAEKDNNGRTAMDIERSWLDRYSEEE